jgi:hypothetical protein
MSEAQTPEAVAFALMERIFRIEKKVMHPPTASEQGINAVTRKDILETFRECMKAVRHA